MSEGTKKTLTIVSVEEKNGFYRATVTQDKNKYSSKSSKLNEYVGKTAEFSVNSTSNTKDGRTYTNWYINDPFPPVPEETTAIPQSGGGYKDSTITAKNTMLMQAIELIKVYQGEFKTAEDARNFIKTVFEEWMSMYSPKTQIRPSEKPSEYISKVLNEAGQRGWSEKDLRDHLFTESDIPLKYDKATEKIVWDNVTVETLKKIIEELDKVPF